MLYIEKVNNLEYPFLIILAVLVLALIFILFLQSRVKSLPYDEHFVIQKSEPVYLSRKPGDGMILYWDGIHPPNQVTLFADKEKTEILGQWRPQAGSDEMPIPLPDGVLRPWVLLEFDNGENLFITERFLPFQRVRNFRDIGGYLTQNGNRIIWGKVFRSGQLGHANQADREMLERLQIKTVIDLRDDKEVEDLPDFVPSSAQYRHIFITDRVMVKRASVMIRRQRLGLEFNQSYKTMILDQGARGIGKVFQILSDPANFPVVFHCTAGKDRAGVTAALLLSLLGVPDETILADYSLSNLFAAHYIREIERRIKKVRWLGWKVEHFYPMAAARPLVLKNALEYIHTTYGSVEKYLTEKAGVERQTIVDVRKNLLEGV